MLKISLEKLYGLVSVHFPNSIFISSKHFHRSFGQLLPWRAASLSWCWQAVRANVPESSSRVLGGCLGPESSFPAGMGPLSWDRCRCGLALRVARGIQPLGQSTHSSFPRMSSLCLLVKQPFSGTCCQGSPPTAQGDLGEQASHHTPILLVHPEQI